ncbi:MAG: type II toxin-antitoxin system VapC family toxin [Planctomycetaceae bacterium]|nr:type II toxin-antitoxin system VapC family toxin [Planctomycetaceae bacterium]
MEVFADTLYWIAMARPNDSWAAAARRAKANLGDVTLVTTEEVLSEVLTALAGGGPSLRHAAAAMVRAIQTSSDVRVISQSGESFLAGLAHYESRLDKSYSMADCVSMQVMRFQQIEAVLTNDHHFTQDGFVVLISQG